MVTNFNYRHSNPPEKNTTRSERIKYLKTLSHDELWFVMSRFTENEQTLGRRLSCATMIHVIVTREYQYHEVVYGNLRKSS